MRIRSTKPEFWQSRTIAGLDWDTRLILKALESYVDDNGVGKDSVTLFCAAAFPHDIEKSSETFAKVSRSLRKLSEVGIIVRYTVRNEPLVYVRRWKHWQYIDKPKQGRYPRPDGSMNYRDDVDESIGPGQGVTDSQVREDSPQPPENFAKTARNVPEVCPQIQSGEQGNRGTEEKEPPYPPNVESAGPSRALARRTTGAGKVRDRLGDLPARSVDAYRIAEAFSASVAVPIEDDLLSGIGVQIDKCLKRGIPPPAIANGLRAWTNSDSWSPTQIPNFVHKANNGGNNGHGKPTQKALGYADAAEQLIAALGAQQ